MKQLLRKLICLNLALVLLLTLLPVPFAAEEAKPAVWIKIDGVVYDAAKEQTGNTWSYRGYDTFGDLTLSDYTGGAIATNLRSLYVYTKGRCTVTASDETAAVAAENSLSVTVRDGTALFTGGKENPALTAGSVTLKTEKGASLELQGGAQANAVSANYIYVRMPGDILAVGGGAAAYSGSFNPPRYPTTELLTGDSREDLTETETFTGDEIAVRLVQTTVSAAYYDRASQTEDYAPVSTQTQERGASAKLTPPEPIAWDGYTFVGWADSQNPSTYTNWYQAGSTYDFEADLTLYAIREAAVTGDGATLTLDAGSGKIDGKNLPRTTLTAEKEEKDDGIYGEFTLPDVEPGSYDKTFLGWSEREALRPGELTGLYFAKQTVTLKSGTTLYAVYVESYAINNKERCILLANGGAAASGAPGYVLDLTAAAESRPEVKTLFTRDGFMLSGWNTQPDGSGASYGSDRLRYASALPGALYAQWEERPASGVLYHGNGSDTFGGAAETVWAERPADGLADLGDQGFRRSYCTFLGWSTSPTGFPEEEIKVPEGKLVELYAVWGFNAIATYGNFQWIAGPVQLGGESGATQTGASGSGWKYDSRVFLDESYPGGAIRTTNDLYLFVSGDVRAESITCGGTCFIEFADNASLTVTGADYGITAKQVQVGRFGKLTASGGTAAVSDTVQTTANLTECSKNQGDIKSGAENTVRTGADEASSRLTGRYNGEKWLRVEGKTITVTYVNGSSRDPQTQKLLHAGVRIDRTPAPQDGRTFMGWALTSSGSGTYYYEGDTYAIPAAASNVTFYAQWSAAGDRMIYLSAGSGTVNGAGSTTMKPGADGRYRLPEAKGSTLFLGWMQVPYTGTFPGWNNLHAPEFDRSRDLIENNALLWPGESYELKPGTALVAVWNKNNMGSGSYHVCKGNGGRTRADSPVALVHVYASDTNLLTYIGMEKEGYFLTGWRAENGGKLYEIGDAVNVGGQRFAAQWQSKQTGAAMLYGGLGRTSKKHSFLQTTNLDASDAHGFAYAGYAFGGWYAHGETAPADKLEPGKAYLAHWKAYVVTYHDNGRTWTGVETVKKHEISLREDNTIFNGWNTKADGSGEWVAGGTVLTADLTLYAQYISISKDVLLYVSDGWFGGQNFQRIEPLDGFDTFELPETLNGKNILTWCQYYTDYEKGDKYIRTTFREPGKQTMQPGTVARAILPGGKSLAADEILLCGNGGTRTDGQKNEQKYQLLTVPLTASDLTLANYAFSKDGKTQTAWNTQPDGRGRSFKLDDSVLTPRRANVHMLYAQWGKQSGNVSVTFGNSMVQSDDTRMELRAGDTFTFPEPKYPDDLDVTFVGWRNDHISSGDSRVYQPGETYTVREGDMLCFNTAWRVNGTYMIDGKSYPYPDGTQSFRDFGDGWELTIYWTGAAYMELNGYHGGAIDFPAQLTVNTVTDSSVTGAAGQNAIHSGQTLWLQTGCGREHVRLDLTGGAGAAAISGKEVFLYGAWHVTMSGGVTGGEIFGGTQIWGGADRASARQLNDWKDTAGLAYVETRPRIRTVTVDGNGGTTADGETTKTLQLDECLRYPLARTTGFTRPGYALLGYFGRSVGKRTLTPASEGLLAEWAAEEIELVWQKADYAHWIAFGSYNNDAENYDPESWYHYTFFDNSQPVTAPDALSPLHSGFICWQTDPYETGEPIHQYFPGETVNEKDGTILTEMYPTSYGDLVLYGNGKTYSDGSRVKISYYATAAASDGTTLLGWNTKPDGSGDSYPVGWRNRTQDVAEKPTLYLYAQWEDSEAALPPIQTILPAITASAAPSAASAFADVARTDWFYADVQFVTDRGLMNGVGADGFAPNGTLTRAMIVTILHRLAKTPAAAAGAFTDVDADSYCADAVAWAAANGIVTGTKPGVFAPNANLTRGQLAAILYRFAVKLGYTAETQASAPFADVPRGSYYDAAVAWAAQSGIVTGMKADVFAPDAPVTRAQAAAILHRFCKACSA